MGGEYELHDSWGSGNVLSITRLQSDGNIEGQIHVPRDEYFRIQDIFQVFHRENLCRGLEVFPNIAEL